MTQQGLDALDRDAYFATDLFDSSQLPAPDQDKDLSALAPEHFGRIFDTDHTADLDQMALHEDLSSRLGPWRTPLSALISSARNRLTIDLEKP